MSKKKKSPDDTGRSNMRRFPQGELSAALGCGVGGRYVTHLDWLPDRDDLITVSADWQLGKEFDRVTLRLTPRKNGQTVTLHDLHVYLLAQGPESLSPSEEDGKRVDREKPLSIKNSHIIEFRLPIAWRTWSKGIEAPKAFQATFLITATAIEPPRRLESLIDVSKTDGSEHVWSGLLKTGPETLTPNKR